ncbi:MAG: type II secretion system protein [Anaerolineales bacterium]
MSRRSGFTMVEMAVALTIAVSLFGLIAMALGNFRTSQLQSRLASQEASELNILQEAARKYVAAQQLSWTAGQRVEISITTLIADGHLPPNFAKRVGPGGTDAVGSTPFGQPYRVVSIKHATDGKVRTIITETLAPLAARLAKVGVTYERASIAALKAQIAGIGVVNHRAIAGTVAAGTTSATGYLGAFSDFSLVNWLQSAPAEAIAVYFLGFPELGGEDSNPTTPTAQYEDIEVIDGMRGCPFNDPFCDNSAYSQPSCTDGRVMVGEWPTCSSGLLFQTLIGTLTNGRQFSTQANPPLQCDSNGDGELDPFPATTNEYSRQTTSLNNQNFYTSAGACEAMFWSTVPGQSCPSQFQRTWKLSLNAKNRICGRPVN